jgi:hypothetical protein
MKAYSITFDGDRAKVIIPRELAQEIIKVQGTEDTDFETACKIVAKRANSGSEKFRKDVMDEARRLHNSKLMKQMNAARRTIRSGGYNAGHQVGYQTGYQAGKAANEIWYYCDVCSGRLTVDQNGEDHKKLIGYMKDHGWGHVSCHEQKQRR